MARIIGILLSDNLGTSPQYIYIYLHIYEEETKHLVLIKPQYISNLHHKKKTWHSNKQTDGTFCGERILVNVFG